MNQLQIKITSLLFIFQLAFAPIAFSQKVEMINAYDAFGEKSKGLHQDFGFSCVVKYGDKTILFDAGTNIDTFKRNIKTLKIDLKKIDIAILSHGHYDHMGGFGYLLQLNPK